MRRGSLAGGAFFSGLLMWGGRAGGVIAGAVPRERGEWVLVLLSVGWCEFRQASSVGRR